jgi:hypothetical protein
MAQTPADRKLKRDQYAQSLGFRNYNALDTYRRNEKARAEGYKSRAAKRYARTTKPLIEDAKRFESFATYLGDRKPTEKAARDFLKAFGPYPNAVTSSYKSAARNLRDRLIDWMQDNDIEWDWNKWREEYNALM